MTFYHGELSEPQQLTKCCNARAIWDDCSIHQEGCSATCCERCGTQLERDCQTEQSTELTLKTLKEAIQALKDYGLMTEGDEDE